MKVGDAISKVATPIARALNMPCIGPITNQLRPESGCAKMRNNLNNGMTFTDAIYQRWFAAKQQGGKMKYQMTVVIEAEKLSEAVLKGESIGEVLGVQARPEQGISKPVVSSQFSRTGTQPSPA